MSDATVSMKDSFTVALRQTALECASRNFRSLLPHEVIEVAARYEEWLATGQIVPSEPLSAGEIEVVAGGDDDAYWEDVSDLERVVVSPADLLGTER